MPQKRSLTPETIRVAAIQIIESDGAQALTMHSLAAALDVKPPSLYNHVTGLSDVWTMLAAEGLGQITAVVRNAAVGRAADTALREIAHSYRTFAANRPQLYRTFGTLLKLDDDQVRAAAAELSGVLRQVLASYHLDADEETSIIRVLRAGLHGFVSLENAGFFTGPLDTDQSFETLIDSWLAQLPARQA